MPRWHTCMPSMELVFGRSSAGSSTLFHYKQLDVPLTHPGISLVDITPEIRKVGLWEETPAAAVRELRC